MKEEDKKILEEIREIKESGKPNERKELEEGFSKIFLTNKETNKSMKEVIKTFCLILITIGFLLISISFAVQVFISAKAFKDCADKGFQTYFCLGIMNGRSSQ